MILVKMVLQIRTCKKFRKGLWVSKTCVNFRVTWLWYYFCTTDCLHWNKYTFKTKNFLLLTRVFRGSSLVCADVRLNMFKICSLNRTRMTERKQWEGWGGNPRLIISCTHKGKRTCTPTGNTRLLRFRTSNN